MADPKKSTDIKLAKDAVSHIETIESLDELSAFVGDDENRKTVLSAQDNKYAELTEAASGSGDEDPEENTPEEGTSPSGDEDPEENTPEEIADLVSHEAVTPEFLADLAELIESKLAAEKEFKGQNVEHTVTELKEAHEAFEQSTVVEGDSVEFSKEAFKSLCACIANQANVDQQRRGLSQPNPVDKVLFELKEELKNLTV